MFNDGFNGSEADPRKGVKAEFYIFWMTATIDRAIIINPGRKKGPD